MVEVLKLLDQHFSLDGEDVHSKCPTLRKDPYSLEMFSWLEENGLVHINNEFDNEHGYQKMTLRILPAGRAAIHARKQWVNNEVRAWITAAIAVLSFLMSAGLLLAKLFPPQSPLP